MKQRRRRRVDFSVPAQGVMELREPIKCMERKILRNLRAIGLRPARIIAVHLSPSLRVISRFERQVKTRVWGNLWSNFGILKGRFEDYSLRNSEAEILNCTLCREIYNQLWENVKSFLKATLTASVIEHLGPIEGNFVPRDIQTQVQTAVHRLTDDWGLVFCNHFACFLPVASAYCYFLASNERFEEASALARLVSYFCFGNYPLGFLPDGSFVVAVK